MFLFTLRSKKQLVYFVFNNSFLSYENITEILKFIYKEWFKWKIFFSKYQMNYPRIISFTEWKRGYIVFRKKKNEWTTEWRFGFNDWWVFERSQRKLFYPLSSHESDGEKIKSIYFILWKKEAYSPTMKKRKKQFFGNIRTISNSIYNYFVLSCVSYLTMTFCTLLFWNKIVTITSISWFIKKNFF